MSKRTDLFNQDGEALILEGLGELNVLRSLVVDGQRSHDHVGQAPQELSHHAVPLFLVTIVHLRGPRGRGIRKIKSEDVLPVRGEKGPMLRSSSLSLRAD